MKNLKKTITYLTRDIAGASSAYVLQDDGDGPFIAAWFEETLGAQPTDDELAQSEEAALAWKASQKLPAADFYSQLDLLRQAQLSALAEGDQLVKAFRDYLSMAGATIKTGSTKTIAAVYYLAGQKIGGVSIDTPVMTLEQAKAWLAQEDVDTIFG